MTKEIFIESQKNIEKEISNLRDINSQLIKDYIEHNKPFNIGDRIFKSKSKEYGFVVSFKMGYQFEITPICVKEKKDGTESKHSLYVYSINDVELAKK